MTAIIASADLARELGIPTAAVELTRDADLIDLHLEAFITHRLFGYDILARHRPDVLGGRFFGHLDVPRLRDGGVAGGMWSITTNPFRPRPARWRVFEDNVRRLQAIVDRSGGSLRFARSVAEYREVRAAGAHACFLSIQGADALAAAPSGVASVPGGLLVRVTLVHLTSSLYGTTSSPLSRLRRDHHLTTAGKDLVRDLNANRVFVDLAHLHPAGFWDAVAVHDKSQPLVVTHTGIAGVCKSWRNIDDRQIKAVADSGGTIGIIFQMPFLAAAGHPTDGRIVLDHMEHIIKVAGEDFVSVGSDYDGVVVPPPGLTSAHQYPRLVAWMLERRWSEARIKKILGGNFLRALGMLRP
ncbi:MAG: membrane dipeptidase [Deltaproteobacteria bacterium]|nr:membrane dipeptidase [Deltaproteobacteria bacterium]